MKLEVFRIYKRRIYKSMEKEKWDRAYFLWKLCSVMKKNYNYQTQLKNFFLTERFDSIFHLYKVALKVEPDNTKHLVNLKRTCRRFGDDGFFNIVENGLKVVKKGNEKAANSATVYFYMRYGLFDNERLKEIKKILHAGTVNDEAALLGLRYIWLMQREVDRPLSELYLKYYKEFRGSDAGRQLAVEYATLLAQDERYDEVGNLYAHDEIADVAWKSLPLSKYLHDTSQDSGVKIKENAELYEYIKKGTEIFWSSVRTKNFAIVGNSSCEKGKERGEEINSHSEVVRFNHFKISSDYKIDYGEKTTVAVINISALDAIKKIPANVHTVIITAPDYLTTFMDHVAVISLMKKNIKVVVVEKGVTKKLIDILQASPSSGLQICYAFSLAATEKVSFYGFSFTDQIGSNASSSNYFRRSKASTRHNWHGEKEVFKLLAEKIGLKKQKQKIVRHGDGVYSEKTLQPLRVKILGDHTKYHCGSAAVFKYFHMEVSREHFVVQDDEYDVLIVNGEGSMHHNKNNYRKKMEALREAVEKGKRAELLNTVWQNNDNEYDDVLKKLDRIVVREVKSQEDLWSNHGVESEVLPDFSYFLKVPEAEGNAKEALDKKIWVTDFFSREFDSFVKLTGSEYAKYPYIDMKNMGWNELVQLLRKSEILITGRHHAMYAACKAEIPFVIFPGNTHKIEGLFASAGINIPMCNSRYDIANNVQWAKNNPQAYQDLFSWMKAHKKWTFKVV
ncbi:polysaccharide pyruvyl transferase family protein [Billgrantia aerodenitrificans]|uniref:Polysaccharide pyruvyl transferase domain-containing protein n=1 Tax=Billgrantia aerodenitrificans TaxID=2733483 RepID=A0ABS9AYH2_9GAMM|nr:polysaccharide pyruvyl transferase family protein [Halomonas aerodenitrificans]MCE8026967.1 hypothetical protein [Halomonas aerodenitrificans]